MHSPSDSPDKRSKNAPDTPPPGLALTLVPHRLGVCRLDAEARIPRWVHRSLFFTVSRSPDELSIVCEEKLVPRPVRCEKGWRAIRVVEPLDFSLIGVLASLAQPLTDAGVSIFCISTYDTDYLLVRENNVGKAVRALEASGHRFDPASHEEVEALGQTEGERPSRRRRRRSRRRPSQDTPEPTRRDAEANVEPSAPTEEAPEVTAEPAAREAKKATEEPGEKKPRKARSRRRKPSPSLPEPSSDAADREIDLDWEAALDEEKIELESATAEAARRLDRERTTPAVELSAEPTDGASEDGADDVGPKEAVDGAALDDDQVVEADGLYTGAIPQHGVELTDTTFANLGISAPIIETLDELGFEHPTPIQAAVIPDALEGVDIIGLAETGSGKTGAFCLPMVEHLTHGKGVRGLILCPTREIALQTKAFLDVFGRDHSLESVVVIGGVKMGPQIQGLRRKPDILVATPGRLADHLRRRNVSLGKLEELVIDEADHMLDLGFLPQIQEILEQAPGERRTMMFSATMPPPIERLAKRFMREPLQVDIRPANQVAEGIEHRLYLVKEDDMKDCVRSLLEEVEGSTLIFVRRKLYTEWLARQLELAGLPVERIHSDRSQAQRVRALRAFREGRKRILVATDVAARGIDIPRIQHVINYGPPEMVEDYVHRAGRTARGNAVGVVSTIAGWRDKMMIRDMERVVGHKLPRRTAEGVEPWVELKQRKTVRRRRLL